jgi:RNA polymerase sigma-70 factor (ECF subfamily)
MRDAVRAPLEVARAGVHALIERHAASLYRVARAITRDDTTAADVVAAVLAAAVTPEGRAGDRDGRRAAGRRPDAPETAEAVGARAGRRRRQDDDARPAELLAAAVRMAMRRAAPGRDGAAAPDELPSFTTDGHRAGDPARLLADWSGLTVADLVAGEGRGVVEAALDALPAAWRAVLVLRDVERLSAGATAAALGWSTPAVQASLHAARMMVRERITRARPLRPAAVC